MKSISFHGKLPRINGGTEVIDGSPEPIAVLKNVIHLPAGNCLFTEDGFRIPESCIHRGTEFFNAPQRIKVPANLDRADGPVVFLGPLLFGHWGHFLTEGISRLWALSHNPDLLALPKLCQRRRESTPFIEAFLARVDTGPGIRLDADVPLFLPEVLLPKPSFVLRNHAYSVHGRYPTIVGRNVCGRGTAHRSDQPVYLSRSRLPSEHRKVGGEDRLEALLSTAGARIAYPEAMTFEEQVVLFNTHRIFIGSIGSAFHSVLFGPDDGTTMTVVLHAPSIKSNYMLIDQIKNVQAHYLDCLKKRTAQEPGTHQVAINFDIALPILKQLGIL